jgi:hypothetical protein
MIGPKLCLRERLGMMPMRVQRQQHGRTFLDDSYAGMAAAVNATLMSFGQAKPAFQIQVVAR